MNILAKIFNYSTEEERTGISLKDNVGWRIKDVNDPQIFFMELKTIASSSTVLALHDPLIDELRTFLENNSSPNKVKVQAGTIWPRSKIFHIDCTEENLSSLEIFSENCAKCEMGSHIHLYSGSEVILEWHDAFDDPIELNQNIDESIIKKFSEEVGGTYEKIET